MNLTKYYQELFLVSTDTIVGIGAKVTPQNYRKIFELKNRPTTKKLVIMCANETQVKKFITWNQEVAKYAAQYWPGAVTFVIEGLALRIPQLVALQTLITKLGPIYVTSANKSGQKALSWDAAQKAFPEITNYHYFAHHGANASTIFELKTKKVWRQGTTKVEVL